MATDEEGVPGPARARARVKAGLYVALFGAGGADGGDDRETAEE